MGVEDMIRRKFGHFGRTGNQIHFDRNNLSAELAQSHFGELGEVTVLADEVIVKLNKAHQIVRKVDTKLDRTEAQAKRINRMTAGTRGSRATRSAALRNRAFRVNGESMMFGPVRIGKNGFTANRSYLGGASGVAMSAAFGLHMVGAAGSGIINLQKTLQQKQDEGATRQEIASEAARGVGKGITKGIHRLFGSEAVTTFVGQLKGFSEDDSRAWQERHWDRIFDSRESIENRRREARRKIIKAGNEATKAGNEMWEKIGTWMPENITLKGRRELQAFNADKTNEFARKQVRMIHENLREAAERNARPGMFEVP